jgi:long-chain acyl-CoA synthetase
MTYLPLAHILEFVSEHCALFNGYVMGYGNPKTLADSQVRNCAGDIREFKPSVIAGVPAVFESIKKGIVAKVSAASPVARGLFWGALKLKSFLLRNGLPGWGIMDTIVFNKIRAATGGNIKCMVVGGGPIARDTQEFISMTLAPLIKGYGLTESTAVGAMMDPCQWTLDALGQPYPCLEVKLVDFADAGYLVTNKPYPQGEILLRGPAVSKGYFNNEKETKAAMTDDGWLRTGDIGEFLDDGHLRLIDRKKNLVKTLNGEYIALEKLEAVYRASPLVANVCVFADESHSKPIALVVPAEPALRQFADSYGVVASELTADHRLQRLVLESLQKLGRESGLVSIEIVEGAVLCDEEWTPQNVSFHCRPLKSADG